MRVGVYIPGFNDTHITALKAFAEGVEACGDEVFLSPVEKYQPCDVAAVFGIYKKQVPASIPRGRIIQTHMEAGKRVVIIDSGYVRRDRYFMVGFDGLNGRADFRNRGMYPDRWDKLGVDLKPWRETGEHIVLCGQIPWDASVQHTDHLGWCRQTAAALEKLTKRRVVFRPHPLAGSVQYNVRAETSTRTLAEDLENAWAVVTFNSNAGVDAAIAGIPVFVADVGAMALPVANTILDAVGRPKTPERAEWAASLAYAQWEISELKSGGCWKHLRGGAEGATE